MIAGLSPVTSGSIDWAGSTSDHAKDISFMFQETTLMPWANVFENVWLPLRLESVAPATAVTNIFVPRSVYESVYQGSRLIVMAARPGRIIAVDKPYSRTDSFRNTPH